jgi:RNA polymerase sigma factor FliA
VRLTPEELADAWTAYRRDGDPEALDVLVRGYAPLAGYLAHRALVKAPEHQDPEEILSFAQDGLLDALRKFDPAQGVKFET